VASQLTVNEDSCLYGKAMLYHFIHTMTLD
jgi:hypothetical protein